MILQQMSARYLCEFLDIANTITNVLGGRKTFSMKYS